MKRSTLVLMVRMMYVARGQMYMVVLESEYTMQSELM